MQKNIWQKVLFFGLVFGPLYPLCLAYLSGLGISMICAADMNQTVTTELLVGAGLLIIFPLVIYTSYRRYYQARNRLGRIFVLYAGWFFLSTPIIFLGLNAIGGISVAMQEGAAGSYLSRLPSYLLSTLGLFLIGNILIIPWILVMDLILQRAGKSQGK